MENEDDLCTKSKIKTKIKIIATAKEVGVLTPEVPQ